MAILGPILLGVLFLSGLFVLVAFGYWGFHMVSGFSKYVLCLVAPLLVAVFWGTFLSPKASIPVPISLRTLLQLTVFATGTIALYSSGHSKSALFS
ncbi:YrdB family protein [Fictibacillus sp. NRS-1165]|uniref:YrdB family protein n=1 Tax=Fictibacillus sp. NRS-1165 TaxID=3144463 RepID=UPI003D1F7719